MRIPVCGVGLLQQTFQEAEVENFAALGIGKHAELSIYISIKVNIDRY